MNSFTQSLAAKQRENTENQPKTREKSRKELLEEWKKETSEKRRASISKTPIPPTKPKQTPRAQQKRKIPPLQEREQDTQKPIIEGQETTKKSSTYVPTPRPSIGGSATPVPKRSAPLHAAEPPQMISATPCPVRNKQPRKMDRYHLMESSSQAQQSTPTPAFTEESHLSRAEKLLLWKEEKQKANEKADNMIVRSRGSEQASSRKSGERDSNICDLSKNQQPVVSRGTKTNTVVPFSSLGDDIDDLLNESLEEEEEPQEVDFKLTTNRFSDSYSVSRSTKLALSSSSPPSSPSSLSTSVRFQPSKIMPKFSNPADSTSTPLSVQQKLHLRMLQRKLNVLKPEKEKEKEGTSEKINFAPVYDALLSGNADQARKVFNSMRETYGPSIESNVDFWIEQAAVEEYDQNMAKVVDLYERAFFSVPRSQAKRIEEGLRGCLLRMKRLSEMEEEEEKEKKQGNTRQLQNQLKGAKDGLDHHHKQRNSKNASCRKKFSVDEIPDECCDFELPKEEITKDETDKESQAKKTTTTKTPVKEAKSAKDKHAQADEWALRKKMLHEHREKTILKYQISILVQRVAADLEKFLLSQSNQEPVQHSEEQEQKEEQAEELKEEEQQQPGEEEEEKSPVANLPEQSGIPEQSQNDCSTPKKKPIIRGLGLVSPCPSKFIQSATPQRMRLHPFSHHPSPSSFHGLGGPGRELVRVRAPLVDELDISDLFGGGEDDDGTEGLDMGSEIDNYLVMNSSDLTENLLESDLVPGGARDVISKESEKEEGDDEQTLLTVSFDKDEHCSETEDFLALLRQAQQFVTDAAQVEKMTGRYVALVVATPSRKKRSAAAPSSNDDVVFVTPVRRSARLYSAHRTKPVDMSSVGSDVVMQNNPTFFGKKKK